MSWFRTVAKKDRETLKLLQALQSFWLQLLQRPPAADPREKGWAFPRG